MLRSPDGAHEPLSQALGRVGGAIGAMVGNTPGNLKPDALAGLRKGDTTMAGGGIDKDLIRYSFGAEFVEVRVHLLTREARVSRIVGAFAAGTIVNPITARSQLMGSMIRGIGSALHEATEIDHRTARYTNDNLAEYVIPVNADVPDVEVLFVAERDDEVNPLGIKGVGELGGVGTNAAICNTIHHATGIRSRLNTAFVAWNFVGAASGSALAGVLWQHGGWASVMTGAAILSALALICWAAGRRIFQAVSVIA